MGLRKPCYLLVLFLSVFIFTDAVIVKAQTNHSGSQHISNKSQVRHVKKPSTKTPADAKKQNDGLNDLKTNIAPAHHQQMPLQLAKSEVIQSILKGWKFKKLSDPNSAPQPADTSVTKTKVTHSKGTHLLPNYYPAQVPGNIFTDLAANKLLPDINQPGNAKKVQWVENADWEYKCTFKVDPQLFAKTHINLNLEGLDTYARVFLNDSLVLRANDMFIGWDVPVKDFLKTGENTLRIDFESPLKHVYQSYQDLPYKLPAEYDLSDKKLSMFTRKAAYQYGSETGPRFVGCGIWKPVSLIGFNDVHIRSVQFKQNLLDAHKANMTAIFEIEGSDKENQLIIELDCAKAGLKKLIRTVSIQPGIHEVSVNFEILKPTFWWPLGMGKPELYDIKASVRNLSDHGLDSMTQSIGLRTIELVNKADSSGRSFYFKVNGVPVFMKGAIYVPQDMFPGKVNRQKYEELFQAAIESNFNMLRVTGTGIYERSLFYDLADQKGILIWQDFMFGGRMYPPADSSLVRTIRREAQYTIKQLRNHPSIAIWAGNTGVEKAWRTGAFDHSTSYTPGDSAQINNAYKNLFENILPVQVHSNDPGRFYLPSSGPYFPSLKVGKSNADYHEWDVWKKNAPIETYKTTVGRFMSEYGFQAFPSLRTMHTYNLHIDDNADTIDHSKPLVGDQRMLTYLENEYRLPLNFSDFWYESQLMQGEAIKMGIEAHRRARNYCMGSLYSQFNESSAGTGYAVIDYAGRKKAAYYFAKSAFKPIIVSAVETKGKIMVYIVSDQLRELNATLKIQFYTIEGDVITDKRMDVLVYPNTSHLYFTIDRNQVLKGLDSSTVYLKTSLEKEGEVISNNILYFAPIKYIPFEEPEVNFQTQRAGKYFWLTIKSFRLAKNIYLDTKGVECTFSDNFFDLLPGESKIILVKPAKEVPDFGKILKIQTLNTMVRP